MDDQSFELLISKLDSLEAGQSRIEEQFNARLDRQNDLFEQHVKDDKALAEHIIAVDKEVTFAKGVTYAVNAAGAFLVWVAGWGK